MTVSETVKSGLIEAARHASRTEIMPRFRNLPEGAVETKTHPDDLVTIADKQSELVIAERALDLMPGALIVGEEAVAEDPALLAQMASAETSVIIDPIDGTSNFVMGLSVFGVIIAVHQNGQTQFGLLYDPILDDWIVAERGKGAYFENAKGMRRRLTLPPAKPLDQLRGHIPLFLFPKDQQAQLASAYPKFNRITTLRCSCHEYRMMALGHCDFTLNGMAKPWDHAAGALIIEECGGASVAPDRRPYDPANPQSPLWTFTFRDEARQAEVMETLLG